MMDEQEIAERLADFRARGDDYTISKVRVVDEVAELSGLNNQERYTLMGMSLDMLRVVVDLIRRGRKETNGR